MPKHVFVNNVTHSGTWFSKGDLCPPEVHAELTDKSLVSEVPEPKPESEPKPAPKAKG